jgi:glycosyltransferase involved in cell wall biosynthesis
MKLSVIIPTYNEEKTIETLVNKVLGVKLPNAMDKEIVIIDDCSIDRTAETCSKFANNSCIKIIRHSVNQGKGVSVRDGIMASTGDVIVIQDADLEYNPEEFSTLLSPILAGDADVVYGSRFTGIGAHHVLYFWHSVGNKVLTLFSNMMTNLNLTDMETCYKMFTRNVADDIKVKLCSKRFGIEPEITARVKKYRIYEVGISYRGRTYAEGKKIGWKDGFSAIFAILRFNLFW